jgi:hypothetical protein
LLVIIPQLCDTWRSNLLKIHHSINNFPHSLLTNMASSTARIKHWRWFMLNIKQTHLFRKMFRNSLVKGICDRIFFNSYKSNPRLIAIFSFKARIRIRYRNEEHPRILSKQVLKLNEFILRYI